jgi:hypothetical protein
MAGIQATCEHDLLCVNGLPAKAGAEGNLGTGGQRPCGHSDLGLPDQYLCFLVGQIDTPLGL